MSDAKPRILFVGHDASRSGAPILLLHFLRWLKSNVGWSFDVLLCVGGPLKEDYKTLASNVVTLDEGTYAGKGKGRRTLRRLGRERWSDSLHRQAIGRRLAGHYDLIYVNSVAAAVAMPILDRFDCPFLCHVHELDYVFRHMVDATAVQVLLRRSSRFVACARAVADYLTTTRDVTAGRIDVVHEFIDVGVAAEPGDVKREMACSSETILIGGAGKIGWRKGTDLFIQIAHRVRQLRPASPIHFTWLGGGGDHPLSFAQLEHDLRRLGLADRVHFPGSRDDPMPWFAAMDFFILPSREDPFPLVCLEAAAAGRPIVCFAEAGGMPEFVEEDCGFVVPYMDIEAFAARAVQLVEDADLRKRMGAAAREKVRSRHAVEVAAPKLFRSIQAALGLAPSPAGRGQGEGVR